MATFTLDDREIPFEPGDTIIKAAHRVGVDVPHYCWHPGLSVAANCRMCLVEIAPPPGRPAMMLTTLRWDADKGAYVETRKPKLQPACQTTVAPGMVVKNQTSDEVKHARASVQEMLLLNHPVDCPICDQAGECRLQDYWLEHGSQPKRMHDEPVHKPKAVPFGSTIVYDAERCIVCTRCVRFMAEVAKDPVLEKRERGNLSEIAVAPGRRLDGNYTLMTEHVCPVGALTSTDFRFKARVWFLRSVRTVCQGCATGCNAYLDYDPRDQQVHRHRPRDNMAVNHHWMCDEGMLSYRRVMEGRVPAHLVGGEPREVWAALEAAAEQIAVVGRDQVVLIPGAEHSQEDNFAFIELARRLGLRVAGVSGKPAGDADQVLRHADKNPNQAGVERLVGEGRLGSNADLVGAIEAGQVKVAVVLGSHVADAPLLAAIQRLASRVVVATHEGELSRVATVLLAASSWAEEDGTFINSRGHSQNSERAIDPRGASRPAWKLAVALGRVLGVDLGWQKLEQLRGALKASETKGTPSTPPVTNPGTAPSNAVAGAE